MFDTEEFIRLIKSQSGKGLFNQYSSRCELHDREDAAKIRENNLREYLNAVKTCDSILIGEAPGYIGCRRTGIPFTDNSHLGSVSTTYDLGKMNMATKSGKDKENSALYMWREMSRLDKPPFVWNLIPLHPYKDNQMTNRTPVKRDFENTKEVILYLLEHGKFSKFFAVGRIAEKYLEQLGYSSTYIRHPSHGGSNIFKKTILNNFETI